MIFIQGTIKISNADVDNIATIAAQMVSETRNEDGCIYYSITQEIGDPTIIHLNERWQSEDDLNAHFQTAHMAEFNAAVSNIEIKSMDVRMYSGDEVKVMMQN